MRRTILSTSLTVGLSLLLLAPLLAWDARGAAPTAGQPYPGPDPHPIPGRIEAEHYDAGGEGVGYHDTTPGNQGGAYRSDDVDVETTSDAGGGYNVGWIEEGEWLAYTVDVASAGLYDVQLRVASAMRRTVSETLPAVGPVSWTVPHTRTLHVTVDGADVTGPLTFVAPGGWQSWRPVFARRVPLTAGRHEVRVAMDAGGLNLNWISFRPSPTASGEALLDHLVAEMTATEKISQLHGVDWMETADNARLGIPGLRTADGPHGVRGGPSTSFPVGIAMAATWDPALLERVGAAMGREFRGRGRNQALAPCLDLTRDPRNGRSAESAGEDPYLAGEIGAALVSGLQSTRAIATVKHFAATNHQAGRREADHVVDARTLRELYGLPFRIAIQEGATWSVMNAYNWINGRPSSANSELLTRILRDEWGYRHYVISDWGSVYPEVAGAAEALAAGCDVEMPHTPGVYPAELPEALASGAVTTDTLDRAVRRVLRAKQAAGLLGDDPPGDPSDVCSPDHRALALEVAEKGIVLLKNEGPILPLDESELGSIALIGPSANVARLDGRGSSVVDPCYAVTPRQGIAHRAPGVTLRYARGCDVNSGDVSGFPAAIQAAQASDVVVFVGGLDGTQEGEELDRVGGSVRLPGQQPVLIEALAEANPNLIVVLESGGVVALDPCLDAVKGFLYAFYPGQEGGRAIARVLFGDVNPGGRLPVTMPRGDGQLPSWGVLDFSGDVVDGFGYRRFDALGLTPQYAFGHGLSYTSFAYGGLTLTPGTRGRESGTMATLAQDRQVPASWRARSTWAAPQAGIWRSPWSVGPSSIRPWSLRPVERQPGSLPGRTGAEPASGELPLQVSVQVTNTGAVTGDEVVQLYTGVTFADPQARELVPMPAKQLRGFRRVTLAPGETRPVTFTLGPEELAFWSVPDDAFRVEAGTYVVRVGGASDRLPLSGTVRLRSSLLYDSVSGATTPARGPVLPDAALGRPVTCSSVETGTETTACAYAVDGDLTTRWSSAFSDPQAIAVDLGARQRVRRVILRWEAAYGRAYRIQLSDDGVRWRDVYTTTVGDGEVDNLDVSGTGRHVRMLGEERGSEWGYSLWAFEVYASPLPLYLPLVLRGSGS